MTAARQPPTPGRKFINRMKRDYGFDAHELAVLDQCGGIIDEIHALEATVIAEGRTVTGSKGQTRVHPAVPELRQQRLALRTMIRGLGLDTAAAIEAAQAARRAANTQSQSRRRALRAVAG